jgi:hypothetical protein
MAKAMAKNVKRAVSRSAKRSQQKPKSETPRRTKPALVLDPIFFHKSQIKPGVELVCYGRWEPLSEWELIEMSSTFLGNKVGVTKVRKTNEIRRLGDVLTLLNRATGQVKKLSFAYLSYSAIWRLKHTDHGASGAN